MRKFVDTVFADAGNITIKLDDLIKAEGITRTGLAKLVSVDYRRIKRLCDGETSTVEFELLARICYTLECELGDILEYAPPADDDK